MNTFPKLMQENALTTNTLQKKDYKKYRTKIKIKNKLKTKTQVHIKIQRNIDIKRQPKKTITTT